MVTLQNIDNTDLATKKRLLSLTSDILQQRCVRCVFGESIMRHHCAPKRSKLCWRDNNHSRNENNEVKSRVKTGAVTRTYFSLSLK